MKFNLNQNSTTLSIGALIGFLIGMTFGLSLQGKPSLLKIGPRTDFILNGPAVIEGRGLKITKMINKDIIFRGGGGVADHSFISGFTISSWSHSEEELWDDSKRKKVNYRERHKINNETISSEMPEIPG